MPTGVLLPDHSLKCRFRRWKFNCCRQGFWNDSFCFSPYYLVKTELVCNVLLQFKVFICKLFCYQQMSFNLCFGETAFLIGNCNRHLVFCLLVNCSYRQNGVFVYFHCNFNLVNTSLGRLKACQIELTPLMVVLN